MTTGVLVTKRLVGRHSTEILVKIGPGEHYVTSKPEEVITTVLGSCVAACIRDPVATVGGMNHFMLPASESGFWGGVTGSLRYGNFAMERLINDILKRGGRRERLEVKIFGGGDVLGSGAPIGHRNADFAESYLRAEGICVSAQHLRGHAARRVRYSPLSGQAMVLELPILNESTVAEREARYRQELAKSAPKDDIELFE